MDSKNSSTEFKVKSDFLSEIINQYSLNENDLKNDENESSEAIISKVKQILLNDIANGSIFANFHLGQLYFENEDYENARIYFEVAANEGNYEALYQLGVIHFDGLAGTTNYVKGFDCMVTVSNIANNEMKYLIHAAQYNIGKAYFRGYGVKHSDALAEKYWLLAADDGNPLGSIKAQSMLGMYYSRLETMDLAKSFFWHNEACGNGSLESQGTLGVMYLHGLGTKQNLKSAVICLKEASERGHVYAMANLAKYYYERKLFSESVKLSSRISLLENVQEISIESNCELTYVAKGISMGCFYYATCLSLGNGIQKDENEAKFVYSKSYRMDPDMCAKLQASANLEFTI